MENVRNIFRKLRCIQINYLFSAENDVLRMRETLKAKQNQNDELIAKYSQRQTELKNQEFLNNEILTLKKQIQIRFIIDFIFQGTKKSKNLNQTRWI